MDPPPPLTMDGFRFSDLPYVYQNALIEAQQELNEGDITQKGFEKRKRQILLAYLQDQGSAKSPALVRPLSFLTPSDGPSAPPSASPSTAQYPFASPQLATASPQSLTSPLPSGLDFDALLNHFPETPKHELARLASLRGRPPSRAAPNTGLHISTALLSSIGTPSSAQASALWSPVLSARMDYRSHSPDSSRPSRTQSPGSPVETELRRLVEEAGMSPSRHWSPILPSAASPNLSASSGTPRQAPTPPPRPARYRLPTPVQAQLQPPPIPPRSRQRSLGATESNQLASTSPPKHAQIHSPAPPQATAEHSGHSSGQRDRSGSMITATPDSPRESPHMATPQPDLVPQIPPRPVSSYEGTSLPPEQPTHESQPFPALADLLLPYQHSPHGPLALPDASAPVPNLSRLSIQSARSISVSGLDESFYTNESVASIASNHSTVSSKARHQAAASGLRVITKFDGASDTSSFQSQNAPPAQQPAPKPLLRVTNASDSEAADDALGADQSLNEKPRLTARNIFSSDASEDEAPHQPLVRPAPTPYRPVLPLGPVTAPKPADPIEPSAPPTADSESPQVPVRSLQWEDLPTGSIEPPVQSPMLVLSEYEDLPCTIEPLYRPSSLLAARDVPKSAYSPGLHFLMSRFSTLPSLLKYRAARTPKGPAFIMFDNKGKESVSITWRRLYQRVERVVRLLRTKGVVCKGDRVALVYRKSEIVDFTVAFYGCLSLGMCAVPLVATDSLAELIDILNVTQARLVLTTDLNIKALTRDLAQAGVPAPGQSASVGGLPSGWPVDIEWVKTNDLGAASVNPSVQPDSLRSASASVSHLGAGTPSTASLMPYASGSSYPSRTLGPSSTSTTALHNGADPSSQLAAGDLAYLEFSKSPNGELKGVQVTHGAIMQQCFALTLQLSQSTEDDMPSTAPKATPSSRNASNLGAHSSLGRATGRSFDVSNGDAAGRSRLTNSPGSNGAYRHSLYAMGSATISGSTINRTSPSAKDRGFMGTSSLRKTLGSRFVQRPPLPRLSDVSDTVTPGSPLPDADDDDEPSSPNGAGTGRLGAGSAYQARSGSLIGLDHFTEPSDSSQVVLVSIDPRQHLGLVSGALFGVFAGHPTLYMSSVVLEIPGAWVHMMSKYKVTIAVADYPSLGHVLSSAIDEPESIAQYNRKSSPNLYRLHQILIDTLYIDPYFHSQFHRAVLHPFGCPYQAIQKSQRRPVITPVLTLPEHGSILLSMRNCFDDIEEAEAESSHVSRSSTAHSAGAAHPTSGNTRVPSDSLLTKTTQDSVGNGDSGRDSLRAVAGIQDEDDESPDLYLFNRVERAKKHKKSLSARFRDIWEFTLDRRALRNNRVVVVDGFSMRSPLPLDSQPLQLDSAAPSVPGTDTMHSGNPNQETSTNSYGDALMDQVLADMGQGAKGIEAPLGSASSKPQSTMSAPKSELAPEDVVKVYSFGRPTFQTQVAIVNPNTKALCAPDEVGEIWVDGPALGSGFWALPKLSQAIFYATYHYYAPMLVPAATILDGQPLPEAALYATSTMVTMASEQTFLRTGLMGTLINGCLIVLGVFEDRIQQTLSADPAGIPEGSQHTSQFSMLPEAAYLHHPSDTSVTTPLTNSLVPSQSEPELLFHYRRDIMATLKKYISVIAESTAFDMAINDTYLPIFLVETRLSRGSMERLCTDIERVLIKRHRLYPYVIGVCRPDSLPRAYEYGKRVVNAHLCQTRFEKGAIRIDYAYISLQRIALNIPSMADLDALMPPPAATPAAALNGYNQWLQHTSLELSLPSIDECTGRDLGQFQSILDVLAWRSTVAPSDTALIAFESKKRANLSNVSPLAQVSFQKFAAKVAAVAYYLTDKQGVRNGDHVVVMLPVGLELVYALHACFATGVVPIPLPVPDDDQWIEEDVVFFVEAVKQFHVRALILNNDVELFLRTSKSFFRHLRTLNRINISKAPKSSKVPGSRGSKGQSPLQPIRASPIHVAMIVAHPPNPDNVYPQFVKMSHANILAFCRQLKSDFQMPVNLPVLATTRCYYGYSLMQLALVGVYTGCPTVLLSYQDFYDFPNHWFELLQRYQVKDALATYTMFERAVSKLNHTSTKQFSLHNVRNLSVVLDDRAIPAYYTSLAGMFNLNRLDDTAINNIYTHPMNGLISTRAYMGTKPVTLRLCLKRLRRGRVVVVDADDRKAQVVSIQDSGKIASNTMVAIVNPLTRQICVSGEVGEIWVYSMSNAIGYAHKVTPSLTVGTLGRASMDKVAPSTTQLPHAHRSTGGRHSVLGTLQPSSHMVDRPEQPTEITTTQVMGHIDGGDSQYAYVRTGDLGFLYVDPMSGTGIVNGVPEEPLLFVLGRMNDTFDVNGLTYFVMDVEQTVEKTHQLLENNGSVVFRTCHTAPAHVNLILVHNNQATLQQQAASAGGGPLTSASSAHLAAPQRASMASLPLRGPASGSASGTFDHGHPGGNAKSQSHASPFGENTTLAPQDLGEATVQEQERLVVIASVLRYTETDVCHVANLAPLIVNNLLANHDLVVDEVVLLPMGSISKSRTHEKRRARVKEIYEHGSLNVLARYVVARDPL